MARIIIAEDDEVVSEIVRDALTDAGHVVGVLDDGSDALQAIKVKKPDLVILDCNMPAMNGLLVLREIRNRAEFSGMPVLVLTGRQSSRDVELAYSQGADDYMKKPFDPEELVFRVDELLSKPRTPWR
ncbi:response regulator transcription factor [Sphingomonas sp.]|uniref:response regulator transcription factor n=1 Tax=Sphingomonas sp. TaxID=28214 RepID=UPI0025DD7E65|nr:response regulator transcription factor [Sphingomonas sp.]MBV9528833.1 response regulator transcription factor [Sphingomonas sp.]